MYWEGSPAPAVPVFSMTRLLRHVQISRVTESTGLDVNGCDVARTRCLACQDNRTCREHFTPVEGKTSLVVSLIFIGMRWQASLGNLESVCDRSYMYALLNEGVLWLRSTRLVNHARIGLVVGFEFYIHWIDLRWRSWNSRLRVWSWTH